MPPGDPAAARPLRWVSLLGWVLALDVVVAATEARFVWVPTGPLTGTDLDADLAVQCLLVLLGFEIGRRWRAGTVAPRYWWRAFLWLWPLHAVVWAANVAFLAQQGEFPGVGPALVSLTTLQGWAPTDAYRFAVYPTAWVLATVVLALALVPVVVPRLDRLQDHRWRVAMLALAAGLDAVLLVRAPGLYWLPPVRLLDVAIGLLVGCEVRHGRWPRVKVSAGLLALAAGWVATVAVVDEHRGPLAVVAVLAAAALLAGALATRELAESPSGEPAESPAGEPAARPDRDDRDDRDARDDRDDRVDRVVRLLGAGTLALYLSFFFVLRVAAIVLERLDLPRRSISLDALLSALVVGTCVVGGVVAHLVVQRPALRAADRARDRRGSPP